MDISDPAVLKPAHVPAELVVDFNFNNLATPGADLHATYVEIMQSSPDIFWTPHDGGHWVVTDAWEISNARCGRVAAKAGAMKPRDGWINACFIFSDQTALWRRRWRQRQSVR